MLNNSLKLKPCFDFLKIVVVLLLTACIAQKEKVAVKLTEKKSTPAPVASQALLSNVPTDPNSNVTPLNITVTGNLVASYSYAIIANSQTCSLASYSSFFAVSVPITGPQAEGATKLCVKGKTSDGVVQANATEFSWYQDNTPPAWTSFQLRDASDGSATATDSFTVNAVGLASGTPTPLRYCFKTSSATPAVGDGCWSTSASQSVTIASATTTFFGWVKDNVNNISSSSSDTIGVLYPVVALTNAPSNPTSSTPLNVTVGGTYVAAYDYVITDQSTSCSAVVFPNTWTSYLTPITAVQGDGLDRLCVKGRTAGGIQSTSTYQHDWLQDSTGPSILSFILRDQTDNSATGTDSYTVNAIMSASGTPTPLEYCVSTTAATPTPTDGCWTASTSTSVVIGFSTTTVYGWARDAFKNISTSSTDTIAIAYPIIEATNLPINPTTSTAMNVDVFGHFVHLYDYSVTTQSTDCSVATYGGSWISATTTNITDTVADGQHRLCIKARTLGGVDSTTTYMYDWNVASSLPVVTNFILRDISDNSSTGTDSYTVNGFFTATSTFTPISYCLSTIAVHPLAGDGCWSASTTQSVVIASSSTLVYAWAKDSFGNVSASSSDNILVLYPIIEASNLPSNPATSTALNIDIYGAYVYQYDYSLTNQATSCGSATYTGSWISATSTNITGTAPEGTNRLCVNARTEGGVLSTTSYMYDWITDTLPPTITSFILRDLTDNSATGTDSYTVNAVFAATGTPVPLQYCVSTTASTPTPSDGCWSASSTQSIAIGFSTTTVYGWSRDAYQNTSASSSDSITILYPVTMLTNAPSNPSTSTALNVTVGGQFVATYDYAITDQSIDCGSVSFMGPWQSATSTNITNTPTDGLKRLCVVTRTPGGVNSTFTYVHDWLQDTTPPTILLFELRDQSDNSASSTDSLTVNAVMTATGTPLPLSYCFSTSSATPSAGCWSSSSTQPATIVNSSTVIYGWVRDALGNMASATDSIPFSDLCDSGTLDTTCYVTSTKWILNGTTIAGIGNLVVGSGGSINATTTEAITINMGGDITLQNSGSINANLTASSTNIYINASSTISATALGSLGGLVGANGQGTGPGIGTSNTSCGGGGGGHGGAGGSGMCPIAGGASYGSTSTPTTFGSGGGGIYVTPGIGGNGGGAIKLTTSGVVSVSGSITATGGVGQLGNARGAGGGGGGSIWIIAGSGVSGTGTISAAGGAGGVSGSTPGGGGGGGRIAIEAPRPFYGTVSVSGGAPGGIGTLTRARDGSLYTNYTSICNSGDFATTCTIDKPSVYGRDFYATGTGALIIASGGSLNTARSTDKIGIATSGHITIQSGGAVNTNLHYLSGNNFTLASGASINVDAKGDYGALETQNGEGTAPGVGTLSSSNGGGGGGHVGYGGLGQGSVLGGGPGYGSTSSPTAFGSGGGGAFTAGGTGGNGGGAIKLIASGTFNLSGTISANGGIGLNGSTRGAGGGAGGSVWIVATGAMSGTGTISALGGNGGTGSSSYGGAGSGGRVAIEAGAPFFGTINVANGALAGPHGTVSRASYGSFYTNYTSICNSGDFATTCTMDKPNVFGVNASATGTGNLIIANAGSINAGNPRDRVGFTTTGDITIQTGGGVYANLNHFTATNITIQTGAIVDVTGKGELGGLELMSGEGLGGGGGTNNNSVNCSGGGAGHGGFGGNNNCSVVGGTTYGSTSTPTTFGSGGGGAGVAGPLGGPGGGAVKLTSTNLFTLDGSIVANGNTGVFSNSRSGGSGSGGSVWITATGGMAGTGTISAAGGIGGSGGTSNGAGGGGGRVAIYAARPFYGTVNIAGGTLGAASTNAFPGTYGSFYTSYTSPCNTGTFATTCTIDRANVYGSYYSATGTGDMVITGTGSINNVHPQDYIGFTTVGDVTIQGGGSIKSNLSHFEANNISINSGGSINANGKGYVEALSIQTGQGPGPGVGNGNGGGGGGYGGAGGNGQGGAGGASYGSTTTPVQLGSSGGGGGSTGSAVTAYGGAGGGALKITANGILSVTGTISANGSVGGQVSARSGGGGSGGSIWITVNGSFAGASGTISAVGGNAATGTTGSAGGGGGGRIAIYGAKPYFGSLSVEGGARTNSSANNGDRGSIYLSYTSICDTGTMTTTCTITSPVRLTNNYTINTTGHFVIDTGGSISGVYSTDQINFTTTGNMTLQNGGSIKSNMLLSVTNMSIDTLSSVNVNGKGQAGGLYDYVKNGSGTGGGYGLITGNTGGGGGGYGGAGGAGRPNTSNAGGTTYGSNTAPNDLGSGGGSGGISGADGGSGGGLFKLNATGNFFNQGTVSANGSTGTTSSNRGGGGGSGGSIWIIANTMTSSSGTISADGGLGGLGASAYGGGGGGGGRIALDLPSPYYGIISVAGGTRGVVNASDNYDGSVGTVYMLYDTICTSGTESTTCNISKFVKLHDGHVINATGNFVIGAGGLLTTIYISDSIGLSTTGNITLQSGGGISANATLSANHISVDTGSAINANGRGHQGKSSYSNHNAGLGAGVTGSSGNLGGGGAGHGGFGGDGENLASSKGATYGYNLNPITWGSGGGGSNNNGALGGSGGGALKITTTGNLAVTGTISANGTSGTTVGNWGGGGGSGGSVWINTAGQIYGNGLITANAGSGSIATYDGGGGGGGRVALEYLTRNFIGSHTANFGSGNTGAGNGKVGSLCLNKAGPACGDALKSDLTLWLAADAGVTKNGSSNLTAWADQSGAANNITTVTSDPNWNMSNLELNSKPTMTFDGNDAVSISSMTLGEFTVFAVTDFTGGAGIIYEHSADANSNNGAYFYSTNSNIAQVRRSTVVSSYRYGANWNVDGVAKVLTHSYGGSHARHEVLVNGEYKAITENGAGSVDSSTTTAKFNIASRNDASLFSTGDLAEMIVYNRYLSPSERQQVEGYLAAKYGFSVATSTDMLGWYKADKGVYTNVGCTTSSTVTNDTVNCWRDYSGRGYNLGTHITPVYKTNAINRLPAVKFDLSSLMYSGAASGTVQTMVVTAQRQIDANPVGYETIAVQYKDGTSSIGSGISTTSDFSGGLIRTSGSSEYLWSTGNVIATTTPFVFALKFTDEVNMSMLVNGAEKHFRTVTPGFSHASGSLGLGTGSELDIAEGFFLQNESTEYQRAGIEQYMAAKYALNYSAHPAFAATGLSGWWRADSGIETNDWSAQFTSANSETLYINDNTALSTGDIDYTFAGWFYLDTKTADRQLVTKWGTGQQEYALNYAFAVNRFNFGVSNDGSTYTVVSANNLGSPAIKTWYFIVVWHDSVNDQIGIQVNNGTADIAAATGGSFNSTSRFCLGNYGPSCSLGGYHDGRIAKLGMWKRVLSAAEKTELYNGGRGLNYGALNTAMRTGVTAFWNLEEASGNRADNLGTSNLTDSNTVTQATFPIASRVTAWNDQSGKNLNATQATAMNQPNWIASGGTSFNNRPVMRFYNNDCVMATDTPVLDPKTVTMFVVGMSNNVGTGEAMVVKGTFSSGGYGMWRDSGSTTYGFFANDYSVNQVFASQSNSVPAIWSGVYNKTQLELFKNGTSQGTDTYSTDITNTSQSLFIGCQNAANYLSGDLAEIMIFSGALTTSERQAVECYLSSKYNITLGYTCP